jgi:hypothetical protein
MKTKLRAGGAAAAVLLLLLAGVTVASATSSGDHDESDSDERKLVVIPLVAKEVAETFVDVGDRDYSQGDQFAFTNDLFRGDTKVGADGGVCTVARVDADGGSTVYCTGSNSLPDGQVAVSGVIDYGPGEEIKRDQYSLPITGGTGKYRTARGEVTFQDVSGQEFRLTLRIIL